MKRTARLEAPKFDAGLAKFGDVEIEGSKLKSVSINPASKDEDLSGILYHLSSMDVAVVHLEKN